MAQVSAWMPLYVGDYLADTTHLTGAEHGAYLLLIMGYWRSGPLPDDDGDLARITATEPTDWTRMAPRIKAFFTSKNGRLFHKRVDIERKRAENISKKRSKSGRSGAKARHRKPEENHDDASKCQVFANDLSAICHVQSQSQSQSHKKEEERTLRVPKKTGRRLPDDWEPGEVGEGFARERGLDISETLGQFRDYWAAAAGRNATKLDWAATWRTWCRNQRRPGRAAPGSDLAQMARAMFGGDLQQETLTYEQLDER